MIKVEESIFILSIHYSLHYEPETFYAIDEITSTEDQATKVRFLKGQKVTRLETQEKLITLESGLQVAYEKLLLATGGNPKTLPFVATLPENVASRIMTYRTVRYERVRKMIKECL
jgi:NAD(P)H-nitrite reductase large subunit